MLRFIKVGDGVEITLNGQSVIYVILQIFGSGGYISKIVISLPNYPEGDIISIYPEGGIWKVKEFENVPYQIKFIPGPILNMQILLEPGVLQSLCENTPITDLNNFRIANNLDLLQCQVPLNDKDGQIIHLVQINDQAIYLYNQIIEKGSIKTLFNLIQDQRYLDDESEIEIKDAPELVEILLKSGLNPNILNKKGISILDHASTLNNLEMVQLLLEYGADPNLRTTTGQTALIDAAYQMAGPEVIKVLLDNGAKLNDVDDIGNKALLAAVYTQKIDTIEFLLSIDANPNHINNKNEYVLSFSPFNTFYDISYVNEKIIKTWNNILELLLNYGTDPNLLDDYSPLLTEVKNNNLDGVRILLSYGADPNYQDEADWTSLMYASNNNQSELVEVLLNNGSESNIQNNAGLTALDIAAKNNYLDIVKLLSN